VSITDAVAERLLARAPSHPHGGHRLARRHVDHVDLRAVFRAHMDPAAVRAEMPMRFIFGTFVRSGG
jgi:hypothetical protein